MQERQQKMGSNRETELFLEGVSDQGTLADVMRLNYREI